MASANQSQIIALMKDVADLNKADAREAKKEADLLTKLNRANQAAARSKSVATLKSKHQEIERAANDLARVRQKRADISGKIAIKTKTLRSVEDRQAKDDERARKKVADEQTRLMRERQAYERRLTQELRSQAAAAAPILSKRPLRPEAHDFFISHAREDKDAVVIGLATALRERGAKVWYDDFTLKVGDSLRREIDRGLASSRFGVVVLSEHFFRKEWTNRELDGLVALETQGQTRILPIWHKVSKDEVAGYSAPLADKVALNTALKSIDEIADELMTLIR